MNFQYLSYARSFRDDYRWIKITNHLDTSEIAYLKAIFEDFKDNYRNYYSSRNVRPVHFIDFGKATVLVECTTARFTDQATRTIYVLQGICVPSVFKRHFWFLLPMLLQRPNVLDALGDLGAKDLDSVENSIETGVISLSNFELPLDIQQNVHLLNSSLGTKTLHFTRDGYEELVRSLLNPRVPYCNFLFGVTAKLVNIPPSVDLVAYAGDTSVSSNLPISLPEIDQTKPSPTPITSHKQVVNTNDAAPFEAQTAARSSSSDSLSQDMERYQIDVPTEIYEQNEKNKKLSHTERPSSLSSGIKKLLKGK